MDFRDFQRGSVKGTFPANLSRRWWDLAGKEAAQSISATLTLLADDHTQRMAQYVKSARLYGNLPVLGLNGQSFTRMANVAAPMSERVTYNATQSAIDTVTAKMAKNKPEPYFLTNGGNWEQRRKAKKLNQFCQGIFYENKTHTLGRKVFRDSAIIGDGFMHVFERNGRICHERVLASELFVDDMEAAHGDPRQLHRVKNVDRAVLEDTFGAKSLADAMPVMEPGKTPQVTSDLITVRESWHLPSGPDATDGKHIITIDGGALTKMEPWEHEWFPFARLPWCERLYGFWAQGAAEQVQGLQISLNKIMHTVDRSYHLAGTFKMLLENGCRVVKEHINNDIGTLIYYSGPVKPEYVVPPVLPQGLWEQVLAKKDMIFEQIGVSQLSATSKKPAGLDSGAALREYNDIESDRFVTMGQSYEQLFLDVGRISISIARDIYKRDGSFKVDVPGKRWLQTIDWGDIDLEDDQFTMQCFPISSLPNEPSGRLQTVQEFAQAGYITPRQAKQLVGFPDLKRVEDMEAAPEEYLSKILDAIVDDGTFTPPEPYDDLELAYRMAQEYYASGKTEGLSESRLELLRRFMAQIQGFQQTVTDAQAAEQQAVPQAPPVPPKPSDLVQNTPAAVPATA